MIMMINIWKSNSDDNLPLNKTLKTYNIIMAVRYIFDETANAILKFF